MKDDLAYVKLLDLYAPLLTTRQQEIAHLYFNYDLSLGEIAEQTGVSRQSVYDCLQTTKSILSNTEEKLGFSAAQEKRSTLLEEYRLRESAVLKEALGEGAEELAKKLAAIRGELGIEV